MASASGGMLVDLLHVETRKAGIGTRLPAIELEWLLLVGRCQRCCCCVVVVTGTCCLLSRWSLECLKVRRGFGLA